jgi:hypothetical protein
MYLSDRYQLDRFYFHLKIAIAMVNMAMVGEKMQQQNNLP